MSIIDIIQGNNVEKELLSILEGLHRDGPVNPSDVEKLAYIKKLHPDILIKYESKIMYLLGLFYKVENPSSLFEECYSIYSDSIKEDTGEAFTPVQANAYKNIQDNKYFSFSAPTSVGKSFLFRNLIKNFKDDIVIVVPSRALISEYIFEILGIVDKSVLVMQFVENVNIKHTSRRIFVVTPERASELFKFRSNFNIKMFLFDEAQISEERIRGMRFDALVRRVDKAFPDAKIIFAHPFVENPEAQLGKHSFNSNSSAQRYNQQVVGKIYMSLNDNKLYYFSPFNDDGSIKKTRYDNDLVEEVLKSNGTLLVYISKDKIYKGSYIDSFSKYIDICPRIKDPEALKIIEQLSDFIGASDDKYSLMIDMMERGIVVHHGSIPLLGRLLIEKFVNMNFAKICFSTSTLIQGINMPFDVVWIDNFVFNGSEDNKILSLKNLIGRAGRTSQLKNHYDYGYVIVKDSNIPTFCNRIKSSAFLKEESVINEDIVNIEEDLKDIVEAIQKEDFDEENQLPNSQIERITKADIQKEIKYILDNLFEENELLTGGKYYKLNKTVRDEVKKCFGNIYLSHLRRDSLSPGERTVLSTAVPILLWRVQGRSFSQIVAFRYAYITDKDQQRAIEALYKMKSISREQALERLLSIPLKFSQKAFPIPNASVNKVSLFGRNSTLKDFKYDILVFDTYDFLDKIISFSVSLPVCAAFQKYYGITNDSRALAMKNYIKYGTNDDTEIWLQKYGFGFEEIEWIRSMVYSINENEIVFTEDVKKLTEDKKHIIERYFYQ